MHERGIAARMIEEAAEVAQDLWASHVLLFVWVMQTQRKRTHKRIDLLAMIDKMDLEGRAETITDAWEYGIGD